MQDCSGNARRPALTARAQARAARAQRSSGSKSPAASRREGPGSRRPEEASAHTRPRETRPQFCTFHAGRAHGEEDRHRSPSEGPAPTTTLTAAAAGPRQTARLRSAGRPPHFSCSNAGMLMFQPMACLSNPQVKRLHTGWSSLHAEQHTILLWPCHQRDEPELVCRS